MGSGEWKVEKRSRYGLSSDSFVIRGDSESFSEAGPLVIIVLGASGDLAKKKTFPALFNLYWEGFLPLNEAHIFGYARSKMTDDDLRERLRGFLIGKDAAPEQSESVSKFLQLIKYVSGSYDTEEGYRLLDEEITKYESGEQPSRRLFYLALPPSVYPTVSKKIKQFCMGKCMYRSIAPLA
ncbi:hypothetical protein Dimus_036295 [Dionaea muscipula]